MGLKRGVLLILLGLASLAASHSETYLSEEVSISHHSFPACEVYLDTPTGLTFLGRSGKPFKLAPPVLRDPQGRPIQYAGGVLVLKAEEHGDLRVTVAAQDWTGGRLPTEGRFRLPPNSPLAAARDVIKGYPLISLALIATLLGGSWMALRWRRQARSTAQEVEVLSSRLDTAGDPLIGKSIGRYRVEARLGQGGMGAVYRVVDDVGEYAAKVIYFNSLEGPSVDRFRREFRLLSQLQHATFPRCYDYLEQEGMACCIMELIAGRTLRQLIQPAGLPWSTVWPWIRAILTGLEFAHERGIVHRDLKPENIMIQEEQVKILDFGLARKSQMTAITMTGQAFGTPGYIAPEQVHASGTEVDRRTDLYSLGVIVYELLRGTPPFQADGPEELVRMQANQPAPPLEVQGLPQGVVEVVAVMLARNPANRYASARRVLEILEGIGGSDQSQDTAAVTRPSL